MIALIKGGAQVLIFMLVSLAMNELARLLHLSIPGSILGVGLVFGLLHFKVIKLEWVDAGAKWLLAEMLLFFIPSAAGLIQYKELIAASGPRILLVLLCSTAVVMVGSGLVAQKIVKYKEGKSG